MNLQILTDELTNDPLTRGYSGMSDANVAIDINTHLVTVDRNIIPAHEAIDALDATEWAALSANEKGRISLIVSAGEINVKSSNVRTAFGTAFGVGTATRANLVALQTEQITRGQELGLPKLRAGEINEARS